MALFTNHTALAQPEGITWQQTIGAESTEWAGGIDNQPSGYVICGYSDSELGDFSETLPGYDMFITTIDINGNIDLILTIGSSGYDEANDVVVRSQGGIAVIGLVGAHDEDITISDEGSTDCWLGMLDDELNITQQYGFGGNLVNEGTALIETSDGGLLLTGFTTSTSNPFGTHLGSNDVFLAKLDNEMNLVWSGNYGGSEFDRPTDLIETSNGYVITAISSSSDGHLESNMGDLDAWVFKVDLNGEVIWSSSYGGSNTDRAESLILMQDQSIAVVGFSNSIDGDIQNNIGSRDATITLFSAEGQFLSHLNVGTTSNDCLYSITLDQEGDLICLGNTEASTDFGGLGGRDYHVVSIDEELIVNWEQTFGGSLADGGVGMIPDENGLVVIGEHFGSDGDILENAGLKDVSILRLGEVLMIEGYTDPLACNYHPEATIDDGTCEYIEVVEIQGELMSTLATNEEYTYPGDIQNNFTWDVVGAEILSGQGSNSINVNWNSIGIGSVCVTESSSEDCIGEQVCIDVDVMPTWIPTLNHPLFKLTPNPSDGLIQVQVTSQEIGSRCIIHNSRGQLIQDIRMDAETNSIDLRVFPAGLYVVTLRNNIHNHTKRLLLK